MAGGGSGRTVGERFTLLERLGSGGMGTVWRARDTALEREVALKEVRPADRSLDPEGPEGSAASRLLRERVLREARALARISHPHVVTVHHIVDGEGPYPWLVMELVTGGTLQELLTSGPLDPRTTARIGREVLSGLRTAHAAGIQHRDVKPANVLLRGGGPCDAQDGGSGPDSALGPAVLTDFGIAALHGSTTLTATGEFLGSPEYIAPERIRGTDDDGPSGDLWALGMLLYACAEGHSPFRRGTDLATLAAVLDDPLPPPVRSGALTPVLTSLLVRDVSARPDAERLDRMLSRVAEGREVAPEDLPYGAKPQVTPPATTVTAPPVPPSPQPPQPSQPPAWPAAYGSEAPAPGQAQVQAPAHEERTGPVARRRGRGLLAASAATAAAVLLAGGGYLLAQQGTAEGERVRAGASAQPRDDTHRQTPADAVPTRSPGPGDRAKPSPDRAAGQPGATGSDSADPPGVPRHPVNAWVAQLASVPKSRGEAARLRQHAALVGTKAAVRYLDSDKFASLRPGYWMFYAAGPAGTAVAPGESAFRDGAGVVGWCRAEGRKAPGGCVGRYLSHRAADRVYLCAPARGGGTEGRCTRP